MTLLFNHTLLVHVLLLGGDVIATIVVGWGILWEAPSQPTWRHHIAMWLVIFGVGAETICSISLFAFDESISHVQQDKIIRLESRIAPREIDPAALADLLSKFPNEPFDVCITPGTEDEFLHEVVDALRLAGWTPRSFGGRAATEQQLSVPNDMFPGIGVCSSTYVTVIVLKSAEPQFGLSASALATALQKLGVPANAEFIIDDAIPTMRTDSIHIEIGSRL